MDESSIKWFRWQGQEICKEDKETQKGKEEEAESEE